MRLALPVDDKMSYRISAVFCAMRCIARRVPASASESQLVPAITFTQRSAMHSAAQLGAELVVAALHAWPHTAHVETTF